MLILTIRTDKPEAEIGLYNGKQQLDYHVWRAHLKLAETLHTVVADVLTRNGKDLHDIEGIVCFQGPGSFTGLRIGLTVANTLASALYMPIVGTQKTAWIDEGITQLLHGKNQFTVLPVYGAPVHITPQKK